MPQLSIILPVHNAKTTILRAVQSVLNSEFRDFEFLIGDDGSSDGTASVLHQLTDPRIRCFFGPHRGLVSILTELLAQTRSPIIARMDADDRATADRFALQMKCLQQPKIDAVGGRVRIIDLNGHSVPSWERYESWVNSHLTTNSINAYRFVESPIVNPTAMARREVFDLGFREGPWPEDYDFWLRVIARGYQLAKVPHHILDWTDRPSRYTRTDPRFSPEAFDRCRRMHLVSGPLRDVRTVDLWGAGQTGKPWLHWLLDTGYNVRHVVEVSEKKVGQTIRDVPIIAPAQFPPADGTPLIIAVGAAGARELIEVHIRPKGYLPGQNAWFVA